MSVGQGPAVVVEPEAEIDESKVDCCASVSESDLVAGDAAEADLAAAASEEPGNGALHHWAVLSVGLNERGCASVSSSGQKTSWNSL